MRASEYRSLVSGGVEFSEVVKRRKMVHVFDQRADRTGTDRRAARHRPARVRRPAFRRAPTSSCSTQPEALASFWEATTNPGSLPEPGELRGDAAGAWCLLVSDASRYIERYSRPDKIDFGLDTAEAWPVPFWDTDTAMAGMLLLLAAVDAGLGGWYFGIGYGEAAVRQQCCDPRWPYDRRRVGLGHRASTRARRVRVLAQAPAAGGDDPPHNAGEAGYSSE